VQRPNARRQSPAQEDSVTDYTPTTVIAVDPPGCGCTECMTREYVPLHLATSDQIAALLNGDLRNHLHSSTELLVNVTHSLTNPGRSLTVQTIQVSYRNVYDDDDRYNELSWELSADQCPVLTGIR
jgi:hypothetical protein